MAVLSTVKLWVLALTMVCMSIFCFYSGKADEGVPQTGAVVGDPAEIVAKALLCFNDKYIYSSCEESYRLTATGNLDVPPDYADTYCNGPCLSETHLVLNCIEGIMINFLFYNKATIQDIRDTIQAGCGYGRERGSFRNQVCRNIVPFGFPSNSIICSSVCVGNFNVAEHIQAESSANKAATHILLGLMIIGLTQSLYYL
ncbi:uncharacterized protein LOC111306908 [Durio zibethinus]|uniref:Uncharacterized protein LOC111306908 n=1 Tax=Durio zibethinus TaxID=66656 RepID=A0A6P6A791_DURZI|nr:uncharacterized protein LOC111306908 [Durio zibethinus]